MKIKLLLVPSIIGLVIILSIWLVYPAYSNGTTGVMDNYKKLKSEQVKLESVRGKSANVNTLYSKLAAMPADKDVLYGFIPIEMEESAVVDNLNKLAMDSGLLVFSIGMSQPKMELEYEESYANTDTLVAESTISVLPKEKSFMTDIKVAGSYGQIRDFLNKVALFSRYNSVASLSIDRQAESNLADAMGGDGAASTALTASIGIEFDVLKKIVFSDGNVDDPIFSNTDLDTQVISKIKNQYTVDALKLDIGEKGKGDIFMP